MSTTSKWIAVIMTFSALTVFPAAVFAESHWQASPVITHTEVDYSTMIIYVFGSDFGNRTPILKLGDTQLVVLNWRAGQIAAQLPLDIAPGSYNLTLFSTFHHHNKMLEASLSVAIGNEGLQREPGPQGPMGLTGPAGPQGPAGPAGPIGLTGAAGAQGPTGISGAVGSIGPQGPQGLIGLTGPAGPQGAAGPAGPVGPIGPQGLIGLTGPVGPQGAAGPPGPIGLMGAAGAQGAVGPPGPVGPIGLTGPAGPQGPEGPQGPAGTGGSVDPTKFHSVKCANRTSCSCPAGEVLISGGAQCPQEGGVTPFLLWSNPAPTPTAILWQASCGGLDTVNGGIIQGLPSITIICLSR